MDLKDLDIVPFFQQPVGERSREYRDSDRYPKCRLKKQLFIEQLEITAELSRRYRDFPYTSYHHIEVASSLINIPH